jgi:hypothetical protein
VKKWTLHVVVIALLVAVALVLRNSGRRDEAPETSDGPKSPETFQPFEDTRWSQAAATVNRFFDAAREGDEETYLRLTAGQLRRSFEQAQSELGVEAFRAELRRSNSGVVGLAVSPGDDAPAGQIALEVEITFADRIERQQMLLEGEGDDWVIVSIGAAETIKPAIPYGTPVFEEPQPDGTERRTSP